MVFGSYYLSIAFCKLRALIIFVARLSVLVGRREEHKDKWCWRTEDGCFMREWQPQKSCRVLVFFMIRSFSSAKIIEISTNLMARSDFQWMIHQKKESQTWEISNFWREKWPFSLWGCTTGFAAPWKTWPWTRTGFMSFWTIMFGFYWTVQWPKSLLCTLCKCVFLNEGFYSFKEIRDW